MQNGSQYDVEGVLLPRPFKIRRLGHFGLDLEHIADVLLFYVDDLGFLVADALDLSAFKTLSALIQGVPDPKIYFTSHGSDHHALLLNHRLISQRMGFTGGEITLNQLTWQVGSLREVVEGHDHLKAEGVEVVRIGRDMPGGNWHVYFRDPDGHQNELYYGIEQVGWQRRSRPYAMYYRRFSERPPLPQMSESDEVLEAIAKGIDVASGFTPTVRDAASYDVGGILLRRPFKITRIGPANIFVDDLARSLDFYARILGLVETERTLVEGKECVFLRAGTEHHVLGLFPKSLRSALGLSQHSTL